MIRASVLFLAIGIFLCPPFPACGKDSAGFSFSFGTARDWSGPVWSASDLEILLRRMEKYERSWLEAGEKKGMFLTPPPVRPFPSWSRCQDIALRNNPRMVLVRANLAAVKAALGILKGKMNHDFEDSLGRDLPGHFDPEDWGMEILQDFRISGWKMKDKLRILNREADGLRRLWQDVRDGLNRDVVFEHHSLEVATRAGDEKKRNFVSWRLWLLMGFVKTF